MNKRIGRVPRYYKSRNVGDWQPNLVQVSSPKKTLEDPTAVLGTPPGFITTDTLRLQSLAATPTDVNAMQVSILQIVILPKCAARFPLPEWQKTDERASVRSSEGPRSRTKYLPLSQGK